MYVCVLAYKNILLADPNLCGEYEVMNIQKRMNSVRLCLRTHGDNMGQNPGVL